MFSSKRELLNMEELYFSDYFKSFIEDHGHTLEGLIKQFIKENGKVKNMSYDEINKNFNNNTITLDQADNLLRLIDCKVDFLPLEEKEEIKGNWFNL